MKRAQDEIITQGKWPHFRSQTAGQREGGSVKRRGESFPQVFHRVINRLSTGLPTVVSSSKSSKDVELKACDVIKSFFFLQKTALLRGFI